jgi:amidophosphoribosyltransferase
MCTAYSVSGIFDWDARFLIPFGLRHSNVYGIDMPSRAELVAYGRDEVGVAHAIGADLVIFQTLPDLVNSVKQFNPELEKFDCSVFSGEYVTGGIDETYLSRLEGLRSENAKRKVASQTSLVNGDGYPVANANNHTNGHPIDHANDHLNCAARALIVADRCNGPMNGADETIGLHNSWTATPPNELAVRSIVS